jgi:hypothetical protein
MLGRVFLLTPGLLEKHLLDLLLRRVPVLSP